MLNLVHYRRFNSLHLGAPAALLRSTVGPFQHPSHLPGQAHAMDLRLTYFALQDWAGRGLSSPSVLSPLYISPLPPLRSLSCKSRLTFWLGNPCKPHTQTVAKRQWESIQSTRRLTLSSLCIALAFQRNSDTLRA